MGARQRQGRCVRGKVDTDMPAQLAWGILLPPPTHPPTDLLPARPHPACCCLPSSQPRRRRLPPWTPMPRPLLQSRPWPWPGQPPSPPGTRAPVKGQVWGPRGGGGRTLSARRAVGWAEARCRQQCLHARPVGRPPSLPPSLPVPSHLWHVSAEVKPARQVRHLAARLDLFPKGRACSTSRWQTTGGGGGEGAFTHAPRKGPRC